MVNHSPIINVYANAIEIQHCYTYNDEWAELYLVILFIMETTKAN